MKKQIAILGSTGSIGTQALQVIEEHPDLYEAYVLTANNKVELLIQQARKFMPEAVVIANPQKYAELKEALKDLPIKVYAGEDALCQVVEAAPIDMVLTAIVYVITFICVFILLRILFHFLHLVTRIPGLKQLNSAAGGIVALIQGLILLWVLCLVLTAFANTGWGIQAMGMVKESPVLSFIYNHNVLLHLIMKMVMGM